MAYEGNPLVVYNKMHKKIHMNNIHKWISIGRIEGGKTGIPYTFNIEMENVMLTIKIQWMNTNN